jgi:hypothetical protein
MAAKYYAKIFQIILAKAIWLEANSPEFVKLVEQVYLALISSHFHNQEISPNAM